ncbi:hypothetical protein O6H91_01G063200 [Diphasiastrum complanatum]|uniref:Uncharacterized protein n=1 Tax=Diphasiastrum complanatum TaxID=34168 RepID=A0ACC2ERX2_DIPCM|nr:hypothetical protein O6H91_01G063200 [Diphasiastrum complanatum]
MFTRVVLGLWCHQPRKDLFKSYTLLSYPRTVRMGDHGQQKGIAVGEIEFLLLGGDSVLTQVLHVPGLKQNLLSISKLTSQGHSVQFKAETCTILTKNKQCMIKARKVGDLYRIEDLMQVKMQRRTQAMTCKETVTGMNSLQVWHERFGHASMGRLEMLDYHSASPRQ